MRGCGDKHDFDLGGGGKKDTWCGQTNERLTVRDTIHETTGLRTASGRAHANDGVMSGRGISKVKSHGVY